MSSSSYLIVGSGVFGASTALHLIRQYPHASITLIDRDNFNAERRVAASWDWNKVVRGDYTDIVYTKLALEAQKLWREDRIWQPYYHESGVVYISTTALAKKVIKNFDDLGVKIDVRECSVDETRTLYDGLFDGADYTGVEKVLVNKTSGWAEAKEALQTTIETAVKLGVKYITAEVRTVEIEKAGGQRRCRGVKTASEEVISADKVILCTGAFTARLLVDSAPEFTDLHAGGRIIAAAVTEAIEPFANEKGRDLNTTPVGVNDNPTENGCDYGFLPLPKMSALKYWGQVIVRNTIQHPITREFLSTPPLHPDYAQWDVPVGLKEDVRGGPMSMFGRKDSQGMEEFRVCWEALTPSSDFIVSPHSACDGLFIATCGSFHGFKFLPILGKYVVEMLSGNLDPGLQKKWAWDRELPSTGENSQWPRKELRDMASQSTL